jgi:plastocyanin
MNRFFNKRLSGNQNPVLISFLAVAIVLIALVTIDLFKDKSSEPDPVIDNVSDNLNENKSEEIDYEVVRSMEPQERNLFKEDVPSDVKVPEIDTQLEESQKKEIALPNTVIPSNPGSSSSFRSFAIIADNDNFSPLKVIANLGDTINISFTAVDKDYDIVFPSYNMRQRALMGQTQTLRFKAREAGSFSYYCSVCGGPETGPRGNIIIVAP